jgi:hypothetical protein
MATWQTEINRWGYNDTLAQNEKAYVKRILDVLHKHPEITYDDFVYEINSKGYRHENGMHVDLAITINTLGCMIKQRLLSLLSYPRGSSAQEIRWAMMKRLYTPVVNLIRRTEEACINDCFRDMADADLKRNDTSSRQYENIIASTIKDQEYRGKCGSRCYGSKYRCSKRHYQPCHNLRKADPIQSPDKPSNVDSRHNIMDDNSTITCSGNAGHELDALVLGETSEWSSFSGLFDKPSPHSGRQFEHGLQ